MYLEGKLTIGKDNVFYPYCSCGVTPQDKKYKGEPSETRIGDGNTIREFVTINRGTEGGGMVTSIGDGNLLMAYVHVAHDVIIHNRTIIGNGVTFAGHITVEDYANISGLTAVHHYCRIGRHAMVGSRSVIKQDVLPYSMTATTHAIEVYGANRVGLERAGYSAEAIETSAIGISASDSRRAEHFASIGPDLGGDSANGRGHGSDCLSFANRHEASLSKIEFAVVKHLNDTG